MTCPKVQDVDKPIYKHQIMSVPNQVLKGSSPEPMKAATVPWPPSEQKRGGPGVLGHPQLPQPKENPGDLGQVLELSMQYPAGIGRIGPGRPDPD